MLNQSLHQSPELATLPRVDFQALDDPVPAPVDASNRFRLRRSHARAALARLVRRLTTAGRDDGARPVLVNSSGSLNASAELILEIAGESSREHRQRVLVVDCNFRTPILSRAYKMSRGAGLAEYLIGTHAVREVIRKTNLQNVHLIRAGECFADPVSLLLSDRLPALIERAGKEYDLVLLNTPPYHAYIDTFALAKFLQPATFLLFCQERDGLPPVAPIIPELRILDLDFVEVTGTR